MKIVGYADVLSVEPGQTIRFMVSSEEARYRADVVRLIHGDTNPAGPGFKSDPIESGLAGEYEGRVQRIRTGSYVRVPHDPRLDLAEGFTIEAWIYATTPGKERQALVSKRGAFELALAEGMLELRLGGAVARLDRPVEPKIWYFVSASYDSSVGEVRLSLEPLPATLQPLATKVTIASTSVPESGADLLIAAAERDGLVGDFYNGKIEVPRIVAGAGVVASWDFSPDISSRRVRDVSGNGLDGRTVNIPMRGATGHNWDGVETAWRHAPEQYGAIHFHDDDLDDAGWEVDFEWTVPDGTRSGVYAVHLQAGGAEDHVTFFVRPRQGRPTARIAFLAPVFSYLAYANEQVIGTALTRSSKEEVIERLSRLFPGVADGPAVLDFPATPQERYLVANRLLSLYDRHGDGSGVCYSSWLRPLLNMRPDSSLSVLNSARGGPHQFSADLHLVDWLHEHGYELDVVTDVDLHREGLELLEPYSVVLTGSHCEYWSGAMLDAVTDYLNGGGRLMYLAGNGLYWVTHLDPEEQHTIELRRVGPSTAGSWRAAPGEGHLSTTGEPGGLWRYRGRAPQRLVGVGFTSQGGGSGRPYERQPGSRDPRAAFIFEGIADEELIGDFPSLVNDSGVVNFEFDRIDYDLGSPCNTILLATATGFSNAYELAEEVVTSDARQLGTTKGLMQADMVYVEYPNGGAVFSASSIGWCACLSYNNYDNNVSRITRNVLDRFAS